MKFGRYYPIGTTPLLARLSAPSNLLKLANAAAKSSLVFHFFSANKLTKSASKLTSIGQKRRGIFQLLGQQINIPSMSKRQRGKNPLKHNYANTLVYNRVDPFRGDFIPEKSRKTEEFLGISQIRS